MMKQPKGNMIGHRLFKLKGEHSGKEAVFF